MHGTLLTRAPVLSLAPDSIAALGELDATSLSDLWGVFTKCKDSLQNGRRLENLSWRLWFDSGRREAIQEGRGVSAGGKRTSKGEEIIVIEYDEKSAGWSDDAEWTSNISSDDLESEVEEEETRVGRSTTPRRPPLLPTRNISSSGHTHITGGSLQRMITGLTTLPAITKGSQSPSAIPLPTTPPATNSVEAQTESSVARSSSPPTTSSTSANQSTPTAAPSLSSIASPPPFKFTPPASASPQVVATPTPGTLRSPPLPSSRPSSRPLARTNSSSSKKSTHTITSTSKSTPTGSSNKAPAIKSPSAKALINATPSQPLSTTKTAPLPTTTPSKVFALPQQPASSASPHPLQRIPSHQARSFVKGFSPSTTLPSHSPPRQGSIAPPPTPAPPPPMRLGSPPPSAMRSATAAKGKGKMGGRKQIFFISSPDDEEMWEEESPPRVGSSSRGTKPPHASPVQGVASSSKSAQVVTKQPDAEDEGDWEEDEDDEDCSEDDSDDFDEDGWSSSYSTASSTHATTSKKPLFAKQASQPSLKPRPPGLLSQLFHPSMMEEDRRHSSIDVRKREPITAGGGPSGMKTSLSAGMLAEQRNRSFLKGAPEGTQMESDDESDDEEDTSESSMELKGRWELGGERARQIAEAARIVPPQSPRTTRRAMLATELSESLRRNLLWERQTRNRVLGRPGPGAPVFAPPPNPAPALNRSTNTSFEGLRAPHPSPATRDCSPVGGMIRRHTTTGLHLVTEQSKRIDESASESETESENEEGGTVDAFGGGLHDHGW